MTTEPAIEIRTEGENKVVGVYMPDEARRETYYDFRYPELAALLGEDKAHELAAEAGWTTAATET